MRLILAMTQFWHVPCAAPGVFPMNNAAFRDLVSKGALAPAQSAAPAAKAAAGPRDEAPKKKAYTSRPKPQAKKEEAAANSNYRDRAAERRLGADPDADAEEKLASQIDYSRSKFLGGDLAHTHLVKGLDFGAPSGL